MKQFKIAATKTYFEVLQSGKGQEVINIELPEILAELCTREILWIFEAAGKLIFTEEAEDYNMFEKTLDFSEELINYALGLKKHEVKFKDEALAYLQQAREIYLGNTREGLR